MGDTGLLAAEAELAGRLHAVLEGLRNERFYRPLRIRVSELRENALDEVNQFRQLQRSARESPELAAALAEIGYPDLARMNPRAVTPEAGAVVQAFNRMVEDHWERP